MNVLYEEDGALKAAAVLADQNTSLQVETPHGKRSKIKAAAVLLRFGEPPLASFMAEAQKLADEIDIDFLWQCCAGGDVAFETLAQEYYGGRVSAVQATAVALRLHGAPMYFYKKGRGHYKAAPEDALKAALASVERKRRLAEQKEAYVRDLVARRLPDAYRPLLRTLLYQPDKAGIEWKALEEASAALKSTPVAVLERAGAIPSTHDYHYHRFLHEYFPRGTAHEEAIELPVTEDLPEADVEAYSIDDATTTEIDDAFSVTRLPGGNLRIGIHIAAPALGVVPGSAADAIARERLSTVYFPTGKITMLPDAAIERYTLSEQRACPALSLYTELTPELAVVHSETRAERVRIGRNLRLDELEPLLTPEVLNAGKLAHPQGAQLQQLWTWASHLERVRRGDQPEAEQRPEFAIRVEGERVSIVRRVRGTPLDRLVSELMIHVNSTWGGMLAERDVPAIYRVQGAGKVRMSTVPGAHEGLGVAQYAWSSSPLRRYVDLVNQRQLVGLVLGAEPPYAAGDATVLAVLGEFEAAYEAYADFQRTMDRYWSLRWIVQEQPGVLAGVVLRESLVRLRDLPLVVRVPTLPPLPAGTRVAVAVGHVDLLELTVHCDFRERMEAPLAA